MKAILKLILLLGALFSLLQCGGPERISGDSSETGNSITVTGVVSDSAGGAVAGAGIKIFPSDYDPVQGDATQIREGISDESGRYTIKWPRDTGSIHILASGGQSGGKSLITHILLQKGQDISLDTTALYPAGVLQVPVRHQFDTLASYVFIPGTDHFQRAGSENFFGNFLILENVPSASLPEIRLANESAGRQSVLLASNIQVPAGDSAVAANTYRIAARRTATIPVLDGAIEEFASADSFQLVSSLGTEGVYRFLFDDSTLYLGVHVKDRHLNAVTDTLDGEVHEDDGIEFMFDPDNSLGERVQPGDFKIFINILNTRLDREGDNYGWDGNYQTAVRVHGTINDNSDLDSGYTIEAAVPLIEVGISNDAAGITVGFDMVQNDRESSGWRDFVTWANTDGWIPGGVATSNSPNGWGKLDFE